MAITSCSIIKGVVQNDNGYKDDIVWICWGLDDGIVVTVQ